MKRVIKALIACHVLALMFPLHVLAQDMNQGEEPPMVNGVWQISTPAHLYYVAYQLRVMDNQHDCVLVNDIKFNENVIVDGQLNSNHSSFQVWRSIGNDEYPFTSTFDGQYHTISGLYNADEGAMVGLFGYIQNATIKNLGIKDSYFKANNSISSGPLAGKVVASGKNVKIENCYASGYIDDAAVAAGGLVGYARTFNGYTVELFNCYSTVSISESARNDDFRATIGGMIGKADHPEAVMATNAYYQAGATTGTSTIGTPKTALQFRFGEVCQTMNENVGATCYWHQSIDKESQPTFGSKGISYKRTVTAGNWGSLVLPFPVTSDKNVQYYTYKKLSGDENNAELHLNLASTIPANTPCFFRTSADCSELKLTAADNSVVTPSSCEVKMELSRNDDETMYLIGSYEDITVSPQTLINNYYVAQDKLWWGEEAFTLPAFRAYIEANYWPSFAKSITFLVDDETTDISTINGEGQWNGKYLENGRIVIRKGGKTYNTQGQLLKY